MFQENSLWLLVDICYSKYLSTITGMSNMKPGQEWLQSSNHYVFAYFTFYNLQTLRFFKVPMFLK